jgi:hypothetical protein
MSFCVIGVKSKASPKFIERRAKHPNGWDSSQMRLNRGLTLGPPPLYFEAAAIIGCLTSCSTHLAAPHPYQSGYSKRVSLVHPVLETCHLHLMTTAHYSGELQPFRSSQENLLCCFSLGVCTSSSLGVCP